MKKIVFMFVFATIAMLASNVFAQADDYKEVTIQVPNDVTVEVLGEGEDQVIEVPFIVQRIHDVEVAPTHVTNVTRVEGNKFLVRSGVGVRTFQGGATKVLATVLELDGEIGYSDSQWRLSGGVGVGQGQSDTLAVGGNLVMSYLIGSYFRLGFGTDIMYLTDVTDAKPKEVIRKRFIGGAVRIGVAVTDEVQLELYIGGAESSTPVVGGLENRFGGYGGGGLSVLL